jgi:hypothetical protein
LFLTGEQAGGATILEAVAMETTVVEAVATEPVAKEVIATTPGPGTTIASKPSVEERVDPHSEAGTEVVVREAMIKDVAPFHSTPMTEIGSSSRGGLELLDDDLIDPTFVALSMESWHRTENWIKVRSLPFVVLTY